MRTRSLLLALGLFAVVCGATAQPPTAPPTTPPPVPIPSPMPTVRPDVGSPFNPPATPYITPTIPTTPPPKAIEDIIRELEEVQVTKAQLAKRETDLRTQLRERLDGIQKQVDRLGPGPAAEPLGPDRVGRILIEGAATPKAAAAVQDAVEKAGLVPGGAVQQPALEKARKGLEKAGYPGSSVELTPSDTSPGYRDVMVKLPGAATKK